MAHDPEFERKHPRDPADGQFTDNPGSAWAARISDSIGAALPQDHPVRVRKSALPGGGYAATCDSCGASVNAPTAGEAQTAIDRIHARPKAVNPPKIQSVTELKQLPEVAPDGRMISIKQLAQFGRMEDDYGPFFEGLEFWDEFNGTWRDGGNTQLEGDELAFENDFGGVGWRGSVIVRQDRPTDIETDPSQEPDPTVEYYDENSDAWIPGEDLTRHPDEYNPGQWIWEDSDGHELNGEILGRELIHPTNFDTRPLDPDHKAARLVRALELLEKPNRGYLLGGYEVLGPDGQWHTIEEAYQDDPDQEVMELIADGLHLPALDTSEELTIRRIPWGT